MEITEEKLKRCYTELKNLNNSHDNMIIKLDDMLLELHTQQARVEVVLSFISTMAQQVKVGPS